MRPFLFVTQVRAFAAGQGFAGAPSIAQAPASADQPLALGPYPGLSLFWAGLFARHADSCLRHNDGVSPYQLLSGQMSSDYFPVSFKDLGASIVDDDLGGQKMIDGVLVRSFPLNHPGGCLAYCFEKEGRKIVYATDNELEIGAGTCFPIPIIRGRCAVVRRPWCRRRWERTCLFLTRSTMTRSTRRRGNGGIPLVIPQPISPSRPGRKAWLFSIMTRKARTGPLMRRSSPAASGPPPAARR